MRRVLLLAGCFLLAGLGGCASFRGEPKSLASPNEARALINGDYEISKVLTAYADTEEADRAAYRNRVAYVWLAASDAEYDAFTHDLSREMKGSTFGSNIAVLLMNGIAVVSGAEAARALAAGSATVLGGSAALKRDVFQDQSISAIVMRAEAQRAREATEIRRKLVQSSAADYPLGDALIDIRRLNRNANLSRAAGEITADAAAELKAAEDEAKQVIKVSVVTADVQDVRVAFAKYVINDVRNDDKAQLDKLRELLAAAPDKNVRLEKQNIVDAYAKVAEGGKAGINALTKPLKDITGKEFKL